MNLAEPAEKEPLAGHGEIDPGRHHGRTVDGAEGGDHDGHGDHSAAPSAQEVASNIDGHNVAAAAGLGRPVLLGHFVDRNDVDVGYVDQDVDGDDDDYGDGHGPGQIALDVLDLAGHVGNIDPAVIGPERAGHGHDDHEKDRGRSGVADAGVDRRLGEMGDAAVPQGTGQHDDSQDNDDFKCRENDHDGTAEFDAQVVDPGQKHDQGDGRELEADELQGRHLADEGDGEAPLFPCRRQPRELHEVAQRISEDVGNRGDGAGLNDDERCPAIEVADEAVVAFVEVDVLAAGIAEHPGDLSNGQSPEEGNDAGHDPDQDEQFRCAKLGGHEAGLLEDAGADDRAHTAGDGSDQAELAAQPCLRIAQLAPTQAGGIPAFAGIACLHFFAVGHGDLSPAHNSAQRQNGPGREIIASGTREVNVVLQSEWMCDKIVAGESFHDVHYNAL